MGGPRSGRRRSYDRMGLVFGDLTSTRPAALEGATQHGGEIMPAQCTKCQAPWFETTYWEARCLCGRRFYRTVGVIQRKSTKEATA